MAPLTHSLVSTIGDFITNSAPFVEVPDTSLVFQCENGATIHLTSFTWVSGLGVEVGLMIDGSMMQAMRLLSSEVSSAQVAFSIATVLPAGPHRISLFLRTSEGDNVPQGPREWSPRKRKKPTGWAKIERTPTRPTVITAIVA